MASHTYDYVDSVSVYCLFKPAFTWYCVSYMFCKRPVMGVSISTRNVSFHERFNIREIMPSVLRKVLSSTLAFRHTVLPIRLVSLDSLDVISPAWKINKSLYWSHSVLPWPRHFNFFFTYSVLCAHMTALPVFMVSKNPISCWVKAPNSLTLILHV